MRHRGSFNAAELCVIAVQQSNILPSLQIPYPYSNVLIKVEAYCCIEMYSTIHNCLQNGWQVLHSRISSYSLGIRFHLMRKKIETAYQRNVDQKKSNHRIYVIRCVVYSANNVCVNVQCVLDTLVSSNKFISSASMKHQPSILMCITHSGLMVSALLVEREITTTTYYKPWKKMYWCYIYLNLVLYGWYAHRCVLWVVLAFACSMQAGWHEGLTAATVNMITLFSLASSTLTPFTALRLQSPHSYA